MEVKEIASKKAKTNEKNFKMCENGAYEEKQIYVNEKSKVTDNPYGNKSQPKSQISPTP